MFNSKHCPYRTIHGVEDFFLFPHLWVKDPKARINKVCWNNKTIYTNARDIFVFSMDRIARLKYVHNMPGQYLLCHLIANRHSKRKRKAYTYHAVTTSFCLLLSSIVNTCSDFSQILIYNCFIPYSIMHAVW